VKQFCNGLSLKGQTSETDVMDSFRRWLGQQFDFLRYRSKYKDIPGFMVSFDRENHDFLVERFRLVCAVGAILFLNFWVLDRLLFPQHSKFFLFLRVFSSSALVGGYILTSTTWGRRHTLFVSSICAQICCHTISIMTAILTGFESIYFVGIVLVILVTGMFIPWRLRTFLTFSASVSLFYITINLAAHSPSREMVTPMFFIVTSCCFTAASILNNEASQMRELASRLQAKDVHEQLKKQLKAAREIQFSLLPPLKQNFSGVSLEVLYNPCEELSGDFFDTILSGQWLYFYLADVTGHGAASAQVTYLVKEIVNHIVHDHQNIRLPILFKSLQKRYLELNLGYDLAIQMARLNLNSLNLEFIAAGTPSPILITGLEASEFLNVDPSHPISAMSQTFSDNERMQPAHKMLHAEQSIYFYTDGATEFISKEKSQFGKRRLIQVLKTLDEQSWTDQLTRHLQSQNSASKFPDDLTVLRLSLSKGDSRLLTSARVRNLA
jgi:serine phosphatase RsbU (regulator of sigma subunit)